MCGIAGFVSNRVWTASADLGWLSDVWSGLEGAGPGDLAGIETALDRLAARFDDLMSFATHMAAATEPTVRSRLKSMAVRLRALETALSGSPRAREPVVERLAERLRDYSWQMTAEVLDNIDRTVALLPGGADSARAQHLVAWGIAQVIENLDRLEVRGRDSAGISVQLTIAAPADDRAIARDLAAEGRAFGDGDLAVAVHAVGDGRVTVRFAYKTAQLIGRLGDNGGAIRAKLRGDGALWRLAARAEGMSCIAHTRWASHGAINLPNCHPLNARLEGEDPASLPPEADIMGALNGDIDNYRALKDQTLEAVGRHLAAEVTTDAKMVPVLFRLLGEGQVKPNAPSAERVVGMLRRLDGSMAIILQHPGEPERLYLGQKGSGQSLFVARVRDGLIVASENYGLAPRARASIALSQVRQGGVQVTLSTMAGEPDVAGRTVEDGMPAALKAEPIEIFSRDIFRGDFAHFFEKEVHEAAGSVRKTLTGRYRRSGREATFDMEGGPWAAFRQRLTDPSRPAIRRIWVTGQGTAAIAAMGIAHLLRSALGNSPVQVVAEKASELSAGLEGKVLDDALVIAISQSGTTTDTNRTVDLARAAGAWIHAIVNRRNSDLVRKSDSHLFTSDGRDIEMAVASTKAFYAQVTAGKLTALCLADALGTLDKAAIAADLLALEALPARIQEVLDDEAAIAACAEAYAPRNRYWAVVGNGPNRIAAEEIRIKLSELCYKSIPVDFTEDKKHIDLSTEPLTIVIANDMPALLAQDTAKEVAIFKAHAGKPIVIAAKGESCFDAYAEAVIRVPSAGAGLDFVLATVAGHLWGFHAARAIDRRSVNFRALASAVDELAAGRTGVAANFAEVADRIGSEMTRIAEGELDAALPPRLTARLALLAPRLALADDVPAAERAALAVEAEAVLRACYEETSRPIDTIRHQAKTVTVGISRPAREVSPRLLAALADLGVAPGTLADHDRQMLIALSGVLSGIAGGLFYRVVERGTDGGHTLHTIRRIGTSAERPTSYDEPRIAAGTKRRALRLGRAVLAAGRSGKENLVLLPVFDEKEWDVAGLSLLHVEVVPTASLQQKTALLKDLHLYEDLFDAFHEAGFDQGGIDFATLIDRISPRDLMFKSLPDILRTL
ncbi:MAG: putative glucosamine--fructose-6-phosphate aminotransferase [Pseudomonadota bacterium]|jgi:glucosamine--fructose-6-phosphate aminotransferase (isomerizing)